MGRGDYYWDNINYMKKTNYSFWIGLRKAVINLVVVAGPVLLTLMPEVWANLTLSGAVLLIINYLKVSYSRD